MTAAVELSDCDVVRGDARVLSGIDWTIAEGEQWVVLGPNGAGKTTLLEVLAARRHPTRGRVTLLGERLGRTDVFELRPRIGVASAALAAALPPQERVLDVVVSAGWAVTGRWREEYDDTDFAQATQLLALMGVEELADRRLGTLSEGESKRVQIARALMTDPELLLLDEPAAGLDIGGREGLVDRLGRLAASADAPTTVLVTHHLEEIPVGFTHALLLAQGQVVAAGPIDDVLTGPNLSTTFGLPLTAGREHGRWTARGWS